MKIFEYIIVNESILWIIVGLLVANENLHHRFHCRWDRDGGGGAFRAASWCWVCGCGSSAGWRHAAPSCERIFLADNRWWRCATRSSWPDDPDRRNKWAQAAPVRCGPHPASPDSANFWKCLWKRNIQSMKTRSNDFITQLTCTVKAKCQNSLIQIQNIATPAC